MKAAAERPGRVESILRSGASSRRLQVLLVAGPITTTGLAVVPASGSGGILNVVDGTGGSSTIANPDSPVTVVSYP